MTGGGAGVPSRPMVISPELKSAILAGFPIHLGSHYSYSDVYLKAREVALKDYRERHPEVAELQAQHDDLRKRLGEIAQRLSTAYGLDTYGGVSNEAVFAAKGGAVLYAAPRLCASQGGRHRLTEKDAALSFHPMILSPNDLTKLSYPGLRVGLTSGCYDLLHWYHVQYLRRCRALCDVLFVGVDSDQMVRRFKDKDPVIPEHHRVQMVEELRCVEGVFLMRGLEDFAAAARSAHVIFKNQPALHGAEIVGAESCAVVIIPDIEEVSSTSGIVAKVQGRAAVPQFRTLLVAARWAVRTCLGAFGDFTVHDVRAAIDNAVPGFAAGFHRSSLSSSLISMHGRGELTLVRAGSGRVPSFYRYRPSAGEPELDLDA